MSLVEHVLLVKIYRFRTHGKWMNMRSRTAEDWCPCGPVCVFTDVFVCVCVSPSCFLVQVTIGYGLALVQSNDCESRCSNAVCAASVFCAIEVKRLKQFSIWAKDVHRWLWKRSMYECECVYVRICYQFLRKLRPSISCMTSSTQFCFLSSP